jgi:hypothetical protein
MTLVICYFVKNVLKSWGFWGLLRERMFSSILTARPNQSKLRQVRPRLHCPLPVFCLTKAATAECHHTTGSPELILWAWLGTGLRTGRHPTVTEKSPITGGESVWEEEEVSVCRVAQF